MSIVSSIMAWYRKLADHIGKIIAGIGGTLLALDVAGQGDALKQAANDYLGQKGAQKIGLFLFVVAFGRFLYSGWKANQHKQQIADLQAQIDALTRKSQAPQEDAQAAVPPPPQPVTP